MTQTTFKPDVLFGDISDEIYKALGLPPTTWLRWVINPIIKHPVSAFAEISAEFENLVAVYGFATAALRILPHFVGGVEVFGAEKIPQEGPLLIIANHPGTCDSLIVASNVNRDDLKIMAGNISFLKNMPATQNHLIHTTTETYNRMAVLRKALRHIKNGGALLIFGSGGIDPDPAILPGAAEEIENWSPSIEFIIRKVPKIKVSLAITSNVLSPKYVNHPLTKLRKLRRDKQRISEFLQVIHQITSPDEQLLISKITYSDPILPEKEAPNDGTVLHHVIGIAKRMLEDHQTSDPLSSR